MSQIVPKIAILGGGVSGLSQSYYLHKMLKKCDIKIFEASNRVSGALQTKNDGGFFFEQGPRSIRNGNTIFEVLKICEDIGALDLIVPSDNFDNAYVYYDGQLRQLPRKMAAGPLFNFIKDNPKLVSSAFRINRAKSSSYKGDCNMEQFVQNKLRFAGFQFTGLSDFINTHFVNSFAKGVYRAESSDLSSELCLKKIHIKDYIHDYIDPTEFKHPKYSDNLQQFIQSKIKKSGSINFQGGIQTFLFEVAKHLENKTSTQIELNSPVQQLIFKDKKILVQSGSNNKVEEFDYVISTLNAPQIKQILDNSQGNQQRINQLKTDLSSIKFLPMVSINLGYNKPVIPKDLYSFGYLIPSISDKSLIGVVFDSCSYPTLGPKDTTRISLMFGNKIDINSPSEVFIKEGLKELGEQTGITEKPDKINFYKWEPSFPEYNVNHYYKSLRMLETAKHIHQNFQLHGRYLFTAAIPELVLLSKCFATQINSRFHK
ncbi:protoporphyrinogen oxidase (macronuclear) [Tetrahymena thermophila SB210]|uniref:Protoporphyrinogen oxidase n=1 Tax=Tetrahymena thermophila (strain SB210) TaxID=312017 RepID=Q22WF4_TETTS|nr:protoporphyrinogen oxidase [Tetrahymena thermophila SB210]EAR89463.2 protoporphyrinogen oxidase [Tetrahymena thermophila SB210]|eukprot:XP_001009708.2 protoporphyrinogen oxidase [Tetrahymena thermophila SB210]